MLRLKTTFVLGLRYLVLTRYSWLSAIVLVALVPVSFRLAPKLLANLFVLDLPLQIFNLSWLSMWCAVTAMETLGVTTLNAHTRFDDYQLSITKFREAWGIGDRDEIDEWYRTSGGWVTFVLGFVAALCIWNLIVSTCIVKTVEDYTSWHAVVGSDLGVIKTPDQFNMSCWLFALAGLATTVILLGAINGTLIYFRERQKQLATNADPSDDQPAWQSSLYACLNFVLGPGYFREQPRTNSDRPPILHFAPGHLRLMVYTTAFLVWNVMNYVLARMDNLMPDETSSFAGLFYGLLTLLVFSYVLPGASFYWDRYRIPVPLLIVVSVLVIYSAADTDHYFELNPRPARPTAYEPPHLEELYDEWAWEYDNDGKRTLIVVDASGGGIQASAWTAQVLTGLHERYGDSFSRSIGLISGVSGGSVGTMFYLANRAEMQTGYDADDENVLDDDAIQRIRDVSRASALEATAWGIAYPDLMRLIFAPVSNPKLDRGWATEQIWRQRLTTAAPHAIDHADLRLSDLGRACRENQLPVPVFNATLLESGQRLQISPLLGPRMSNEATADAVEFVALFPDSHPLVSTAARLSATFPYVTPAARADRDDPADSVASYHVVDGAYVDNEGSVTSVVWLRRLLQYYGADERKLDRAFDRVILIRIQAFPKRTADEAAKVKSTSGWRSALAGPLEAMMRVRSTSQIERGDLEISLLEEANREHINADRHRLRQEFSEAKAELEAAKQEVEEAMQLPDDDNQTAQRRRDADKRLEDAKAAHSEARDLHLDADQLQEIKPVLFDFHFPADKIPLSWKLTRAQKQSIDDAWDSLAAGKHPRDPISVLDDYFLRIDNEPVDGSE